VTPRGGLVRKGNQKKKDKEQCAVPNLKKKKRRKIRCENVQWESSKDIGLRVAEGGDSGGGGGEGN